MINNFADSLKDDKELLKSLANYMGKSADEIISQIDNLVKELINKEAIAFYYNVYYYGFNKIVRYELADLNNKPVIEYKVEDKEIINFYSSDNVVVISIEVEKKKNQYSISGFLFDLDTNTKMPFTGNLKNDTLTLIVTQDGVDVKLVISSTEEIKDNNYIYKNKITLLTETQGVEIIMGTLDINLEYYFNKKVDVDLTNSVDVSEISETDMAIIQNNVMNHSIYQFFNNLSGFSTSLSESTDFSL